MKILVTYSKVFDSEEFYNYLSQEEFDDVTSEEFMEDLVNDFQDGYYDFLSDCKFVILEADESNL